jgi:hypothetical protein
MNWSLEKLQNYGIKGKCFRNVLLVCKVCAKWIMYPHFCTITEKIQITLHIFIQIVVLLYTDDTVIVSESLECMQKALDIFQEYCNL